MAWPCISRVCCLARFWSQLDRSDLAVPLTIRNYSDIEEQEDAPPPPPRPPAATPRPRPGPRCPRSCPSAGRPLRGGRAGVARTKPRSALGGARGEAAPHRAFSRALMTGCDRQVPPAAGLASWQRRDPAGGESARGACRQEYRPWTGAKPSKPVKTKQSFIIPDDRFVQETSYKADYKQIPEVKTRFSPNPSAVFQAPSRILNV
ncbi:MAP6 domain-containing protein 1 [Numida meleagris]|uniref:MAP6 domain-containing protein 1 n=1 Tax=Numida meleagris TaxID=8996 RepID=UPI000B3DF8DA|nr:MAP6 domain-containing protein 1 [Numida meleagris]